jgi:succinate dehydrogenase/fumarate reductase-like Fe-S protein
MHGEQTPTARTVRVYLMGEAYDVPAGATIVTAMEYAGFQLTRGVGCREGFCGACATLYREAGNFRLRGGLACQTVVTEGMTIAQIPFVPAEKPVYHLEELTASVHTIMQLYPSVFRCLACNTCTRACPQDIRVMDYVQALMRGDIARAADLSFDCIRCGLCALRCPAEIVQYHAATLAQRLYGRYLAPTNDDLDARIRAIDSGRFDEELDDVIAADRQTLISRYYERDIANS